MPEKMILRKTSFLLPETGAGRGGQGVDSVRWGVFLRRKVVYPNEELGGSRTGSTRPSAGRGLGLSRERDEPKPEPEPAPEPSEEVGTPSVVWGIKSD